MKKIIVVDGNFLDGVRAVSHAFVEAEERYISEGRPEIARQFNHTGNIDFWFFGTESEHYKAKAQNWPIKETTK